MDNVKKGKAGGRKMPARIKHFCSTRAKKIISVSALVVMALLVAVLLPGKPKAAGGVFAFQKDGRAYAIDAYGELPVKLSDRFAADGEEHRLSDFIIPVENGEAFFFFDNVATDKQTGMVSGYLNIKKRDWRVQRISDGVYEGYFAAKTAGKLYFFKNARYDKGSGQMMGSAYSVTANGNVSHISDDVIIGSFTASLDGKTAVYAKSYDAERKTCVTYLFDGTRETKLGNDRFPIAVFSKTDYLYYMFNELGEPVVYFQTEKGAEKIYTELSESSLSVIMDPEMDEALLLSGAKGLYHVKKGKATVKYESDIKDVYSLGTTDRADMGTRASPGLTVTLRSQTIADTLFYVTNKNVLVMVSPDGTKLKVSDNAVMPLYNENKSLVCYTTLDADGTQTLYFRALSGGWLKDAEAADTGITGAISFAGGYLYVKDAVNGLGRLYFGSITDSGFETKEIARGVKSVRLDASGENAYFIALAGSAADLTRLNTMGEKTVIDNGVFEFFPLGHGKGAYVKNSFADVFDLYRFYDGGAKNAFVAGDIDFDGY